MSSSEVEKRVSKEAVEALVQSRRKRPGVEYEEQYDEAREDLQSALPAIEAELRERLLSEKTRQEIERIAADHQDVRDISRGVLALLEAALDAVAFPTQQEDTPVNPNGTEEGQSNG